MGILLTQVGWITPDGRDVRSFADSHELSKFGLLGHSMGGKTAMQWLLMFQHRYGS